LLHQAAKSLPQKANWAQIAKVIDEVVLQAMDSDIPIPELLEQGQQKINVLDKPILNNADSL